MEKICFWLMEGIDCSHKSHGSGLSCTMTASPKPFFKAPWKVGNAMVSSGHAGWTKSQSGHPCPCQNCLWRPPAEKTGTGSLLNHPSGLVPLTTRPVEKLNWTESKEIVSLPAEPSWRWCVFLGLLFFQFSQKTCWQKYKTTMMIMTHK